MLCNQAEDQLTFATRVTCVNELMNIFALNEFLQHFKPRLSFNNGAQIKIRGHNRQVGEGPFTALDIKLFRSGNF